MVGHHLHPDAVDPRMALHVGPTAATTTGR